MGEYLYVGLIGPLKMVDRQRSVPHGYLHAARCRELAAVYLGAYAVFVSRFKYASRLPGSEESGVAEYIHIVRKPFGRYRREHIGYNVINIFLLSPLILAAHRVRPQECGAHRDGYL